MQKATDKAAKHNEELDALEAELTGEGSVEVEESEVVEQSVEEQTTEEDSAPSEEQSPVEEAEEVDTPIEPEEEAAPDAEPAWSEKTKRQFTKLREKVRKLEQENESFKKSQAKNEAISSAKETLTTEPEVSLPWRKQKDPLVVYREERAKEQRLERIGEDAQWAEKSYPELNPDHESYDADMSEKVYQEFQTMFKNDQSVRLKDVAERNMRLVYKTRDALMKKYSQDETVSRQRATEAIPSNITTKRSSKPSISSRINKASSIKELEALERELNAS